MITLHKMNGDEFILNERHIETIEEKPDTVITLFNDKKYLVSESAADVVQIIMEYQGRIRVLARTFDIKTGKDPLL